MTVLLHAIFYITKKKSVFFNFLVFVSDGNVCDGFHLPVGEFAPRLHAHVLIVTIEVVIKDCETRGRSHCVVIVVVIVVVVVVDVMTMADQPFARMLTAPEGHRATVQHITPKECARVSNTKCYQLVFFSLYVFSDFLVTRGM